ncbi:MAG: sodium-coupled permease [Bacteroidota bacterium]
MSWADWIVIILFLGYTLWDGTRGETKKKGNLDDQLLAGRNKSWFAIGVSVLATQASAITFIGTTGQAFMQDMKFVQFYFGLPIAMVILCVTLVPFYVRIKAYTAYELLETRFDTRLRLTTSGLFLLSRGLSMGISIAAPAYVLALILEIQLNYTILIIGITATVYTMFGGINGVIRTDMKQMFLMLLGLGFCFFWIVQHLPEEAHGTNALKLAGALGKLESISFSTSTSEKYSIWSGIIAGTFLMLSYFGSDQSQVQRYLTARSLKDARMSLIFPAIVKVPMQFGILLLGVYLYVFYVFTDHPPVFNADVHEGIAAQQIVDKEFELAHSARRLAAMAYLQSPTEENKQELIKRDGHIQDIRQQELTRRSELLAKKADDTNYVMPYFILQEMPRGILGLIIAAIFAAALSSIDSGLNSLAASSVMDWYQKLEAKPKPEHHYFVLSRVATAFWGIVGTCSALAFGETEAIVELVNRIGSYFYGSILGVFLLIWVKRADGFSSVVALASGIIFVVLTGMVHQDAAGSYLFAWNAPPSFHPLVSYLWLNPIGTLIVLFIGWALGKNKKAPS